MGNQKGNAKGIGQGFVQKSYIKLGKATAKGLSNLQTVLSFSLAQLGDYEVARFSYFPFILT